MKKRWLAAVLCLSLAVGLLPCSVFADGGASREVSITTTDIPADVVYNEGGYGSLITRNPRQAALIDHSGTFKFPWRSGVNPLDEKSSLYRGGDTDESYRRFYYSPEDDIVSFTTGLTWGFNVLARKRFAESYHHFVSQDEYDYDCLSPAEYYHLDGSPAFSFGDTYVGSPMYSGYARIMELWDDHSYSAKGAQIIDKNGRVVCDLPKTCQWTTDMRYDHDRSPRPDGYDHPLGRTLLTQCGENLFGFIELTEDPDIFPTLEFNRTGFMDPQGNEVIDLGKRYTRVDKFVAGLACVVNQDGKCGLIDKTGAEVIPCKYQADYYHGGSLIAVQDNNKWGFIDRAGNEVIPFEYDRAFAGPEGLLSVAKNGKYGLIDQSNQVVVPLEYDDISEYINGVAYAVKNGKVSIITKGSAPAAAETETPAPAPAPAPAASFTDVVPGGWYVPAINYVVSRNLMDGTGSGTFSPRAAATRGTVMTALKRLNGMNVSDGTNPNGTISREQLATMLYRSANSPAVSVPLSGFPDTSAVRSYAVDAMAWAVANGLIHGDNHGALNPGGSATRAEVAAILMRYCEKFGK